MIDNEIARRTDDSRLSKGIRIVFRNTLGIAGGYSTQCAGGKGGYGVSSTAVVDRLLLPPGQ